MYIPPDMARENEPLEAIGEHYTGVEDGRGPGGGGGTGAEKKRVME